MASLLARLFGLHEPPLPPAAPRAPILPTPDTRLITPPASPAPLKNWCHPFKSNLNPLMQLTHLAKAGGGYYPIGRSGLFHGGIHFDGGTAGTLDQSSVRCLADGEVVAYRIDTHAPTTRYFIGEMTINKPFSRNFVLVRHRLQPPKITGSTDIPPSLTFYSLYMHLQDWAKYEQNDAIERPGFWPASPTLRVPQNAKDIRPGSLEQRGLNVRHQPSQGKIIDFLPRGAPVTVSGTGAYRKLENRLGPDVLITDDGALAGYIAAKLLRPLGDNEYRITSSEPAVNVRAEPSVTSDVHLKLPTGSVVTVSGEGDFRKLERVHLYVHFASLQGELAPLATDRIVVLDQPVPIQAGALIGHFGEYQSMGADRPEEKLHLEVFTGDDVDLFFDASRDWAKRLPAKECTWMKLVKGTPVVPHEEWVTAARLQASSDASPRSAADLLVPKSLLDGLPAERKIHVPATEYRKARNWYRLDGLLHGADHNLLDGWVCEEVDATPWLSPWSWEGYEVIFDYSTPRQEMASFFSAVGRFNEEQRERFRPLAEKNNQGPMKNRLYDIIDRNGDGKITADELQAALRLPALAQAISQMVLRKESEWFHQTQKWDALDELLGHSGSTPHWNWEAEKQRIEQISWWGEVAEKVGLPAWGRPYHFHPVGLAGYFMSTNEILICKNCSAAITLTKEFIEEICHRDINSSFVTAMMDASKTIFDKYGVNSCNQVTHLLAQAKVETGGFINFRESLNYSRGTFTAARLYRLSPTVINAGFSRKGLMFASDEEKLRWIDEHLIGNDAAYGLHCYGNSEQPGKDYRGRGLIHLTHYDTYKKFANETGIAVDRNPELLENDFAVAIETSLWFWKSRNIAAIADNVSLVGDAAVTAVTRPINAGFAGLSERQQYKREITSIFNNHFNSGCSKND
ncbi:glycoside hydrolase family 19 protein [Pseudomonas fluorescens]|uniref:glycoside hydrolase family 19 protein n=1 Tax=Pseudomonas fluorescens TaxID=294 RepID=UPI000699F9AA|nr:glycoside hydrolase family 19 protein [Pseudomonas fluorescens]